MIKRIMLGITLVLLIGSVAWCDDTIAETVKEWGIYEAPNNSAMLINVRPSLTKSKANLSAFFTSGDFDKLTANATEPAKKLLRKLWDIPGVVNIRFSSYQIVIAKARLFTWAEIEPELNKLCDEWHRETQK